MTKKRRSYDREAAYIKKYGYEIGKQILKDLAKNAALHSR